MSGHDFWQAVLHVHLLAMAFFVGGQIVFGVAVVPGLRGDSDRERMRAIGLTIVHLRKPKLHAAILVVSPAIVWLGLELAV
jgi:uncharacterized membrane protein